MTYYLETLTHGEITSGFYASFTQFARLDTYCFPTKHLCDLATDFATHPNALKGTLAAYTEEKFEKMQNVYMLRMHEAFEESKLRNDGRRWLQSQSAKLREELDPSDDYNLKNEATPLPVVVSLHGEYVSIGPYEFGSRHFGRFAVYLAEGGLMGWPAGKTPSYAKPTLDAIKQSKNPVFFAVQRDFSA